MQIHQPIGGLSVVGVRYRGSRLAQRDERSLDAYAAANVYEAAGAPVTVVEPRWTEAQR